MSLLAGHGNAELRRTPAGEAEEVAPSCSTDEHCITCGDVAEPMTVVRIDSERQLALCADESGAHHTVEIALVAASEGDELLVHAGTAIA
jgi:hypothetical protein